MLFDSRSHNWLDHMTKLSASGRGRRNARRFALVVSSVVALLAACAPSPEEAKKNGFRDVAEMELAGEAGFTTAQFYAEHLGYKSIDEMRLAPPGVSADDFAKAKGFSGVYERRMVEEKGFTTLQAYVESLGFKEIATYRAARNEGIETAGAYEKFVKRKADPYFDFPDSQRKFAELVAGAQADGSGDINEMKAIAILESRNAALCGQMKGGLVAKDWRGTVSRIDSEGGYGVLEVDVMNDVTLTTLGPYTHLAQAGASAGIPPSDPLFKKVAVLSVGQEVLISGRFFPYREPGECLAQIAYNPRDRLRSPDFIFWFTDVRPAP